MISRLHRNMANSLNKGPQCRCLIMGTSKKVPQVLLNPILMNPHYFTHKTPMSSSAGYSFHPQAVSSLGFRVTGLAIGHDEPDSEDRHPKPGP